MTIIFLVVVLWLFINSKSSKHYNVERTDYLDRTYTDAMKGFFIILVFLSHAKGYYKFNSDFDIHYNLIQHFMAQGIVTFFLFASGYGVLVALKSKKNYMNNFLTKRILNVVWEFELAILFFVLAQTFLMHRDVLDSKLFFSMLAWDSIGNSNWYIFCIVISYFFVYFIFTLAEQNTLSERKLRKGTLLVTILSLVYMLVMSQVKPYWWYDTILCFPLGMYYALYKDKIDLLLSNNKVKISAFIICILVTFLSYKFRNDIITRATFNLSFVTFFILYMKLFYMQSRLFSYLGQNLFGIYILERIPMMYFKSISLLENKYMYIIACFISTIFLNEFFKRTSYFLRSILIKKLVYLKTEAK